MSTENIKVGVRVKPLTFEDLKNKEEKEEEEGSEPVVSIKSVKYN